jgi:hypothetical protein
MCISRVVFVTVTLCLVGACSHSVGREQGSAAEDETDVIGSRLPPFPDEAVLCRIVYNESTPAEVAAVLGQPPDTHDSGGAEGYSGSFFYDYDGGASLFIGFLHGVFDDAMVDNAPYPSCWSAEEKALEAGLQGLRSMSMSNDGGGAK